MRAGGSLAVPGPGVSELAAALSHTVAGTATPPRFGTPPIVRPLSPAAAGSQLASAVGGAGGSGWATPTNYGSFDSRPRYMPGVAGGGGNEGPGSAAGGNSGAYEDPEIVRRHLVGPQDAAGGDDASTKGKGPGGTSRSKSVAFGDDEEFSSLRLQGGDITRPIYKWTEEAEARRNMQRSKSFSMPRPEPEDEVLDINAIKVPGGFRRNYLRRAARSPSADPDGRGGSAAGYGSAWGEEGAGTSQPAQPRLLTASFLEFLTLYGHFAGEELEEDDEVLKPGEYFSSGEEEEEEFAYAEAHGYAPSRTSEESEEHEPMEDSALLTPSRRRRRRKMRGGSGRSSPMNAALTLLKSFVGTGVLFLPRAYLNGGMLFGNVVLLGVAALSYYCFVLLVKTRLKVEGSFGDIGGILYGRWMRTLILSSIVISQIGFVAAYMVFTAENLQAFVLAVSNCTVLVDVRWLIFMQMIIHMPFSLIRVIEKLGFIALLADAFIAAGLAYIFYYDVRSLSKNGIADIVLFNSKTWTLFIGTAIFTFEGIGLILPIQESMKNPEKFPRVMGVVMIIITTLFTVMGAFSYAAYGSKTETVVLLNLPQDDKLVNGVQFLYSLAILLSTPLQIFPAIKITENGLFARSGKYNPGIKWKKNMYRFFFVFLCAVIAYGGADDLDKFVALVGNFACIPLVYIYPVSSPLSRQSRAEPLASAVEKVLTYSFAQAHAALQSSSTQQAMEDIRYLPWHLWCHCHDLCHESDRAKLGPVVWTRSANTLQPQQGVDRRSE